jgi:hypothetical protein
MRDDVLKRKWQSVESFFSKEFADGDELDLDAMLFLIGVRELGSDRKKFKKNEKLDLMHIAICKVLSYYGYYELEGLDEAGWPHYRTLKQLPPLKPGEQSLLMREAIVQYFEKEGILDLEE